MPSPVNCCHQLSVWRVVHHQVRVAQLAGGTEVQHRIADPAVVDDRRIAERAEGHRDRDAPDRVVDDLVPDQNLERVGAVVIADEEADHGLGIGQILDLGGGGEERIVDRGNAVLGRTAGDDLVEGDRGLGEVRLPPFRRPVRRRLARRRRVERKRRDERQNRQRENDAPHRPILGPVTPSQ